MSHNIDTILALVLGEVDIQTTKSSVVVRGTVSTTQLTDIPHHLVDDRSAKRKHDVGLATLWSNDIALGVEVNQARSALPLNFLLASRGFEVQFRSTVWWSRYIGGSSTPEEFYITGRISKVFHGGSCRNLGTTEPRR